MDLRAQTRLAEAGLPLNVEVNSKQLYWPFTGEKQYQADDLKLKLTGGSRIAAQRGSEQQTALLAVHW